MDSNEITTQASSNPHREDNTANNSPRELKEITEKEFYDEIKHNTGADFSSCSFHGVNLSTAEGRVGSFKDGKFFNCNFTGINLQTVDMENALFYGCQFDNVNMSRANLKGANFYSNQLSLAGVNINNTDFSYSDLSNAVFNGVKMNGGTELTGINVDNTTFSNVHINDAVIKEAPHNLNKAIFSINSDANDRLQYYKQQLLYTLNKGINAQRIVEENSEHVVVGGCEGTWKASEYAVIDGKEYYIMNQEMYKDSSSIIIDDTGKLILDEAFDGFEDLRAYLSREKIITKAKQETLELNADTDLSAVKDNPINNIVMKYRYYSTQRPVSMGTYPNSHDMVHFENFDKGREYVDDIKHEAWGYVEYNSPLTEQQINDYELVQEPSQAIKNNGNIPHGEEHSVNNSSGNNELSSFLHSLQDDEYCGKQDYFVYRQNDGNYYFITDACNQFGEVATGTLSSDGSTGDKSGILQSISKHAAHFMNDIPYDPIEHLCNTVKDMQYIGCARDERVLVENYAGANRVKPTCEWLYAATKLNLIKSIDERDNSIGNSAQNNDVQTEKKEATADMATATNTSDNLTAKQEEISIKDKVQEQLKQGIQDVMNGENFSNWLKSSGKLYFNNYSFRNAMLTYIQKPEASYVMGYEKWKEFGRQVSKGTTGVHIFAPAFAKEYKKGGLYAMIRGNLQEQLKKEPALPYATYNLGKSNLSFTMYKGGDMGLRVNGKEAKRFADNEEVRKFIDRSILGKVPMYYSVTSVFDVSDTYVPDKIFLKSGFKKDEQVLDDNGKPIKNRRGEYEVINTAERQSHFVTDLDLKIPEADTAKMNMLFDVLQKVSQDKNVPMTVGNIEEDGVKGFYQRPQQGENSNGKIVIRNGLTPTEKVAVAFHEMSHADLHQNIQKLSEQMGEKVDRNMREVQAEASAYMTAQNFGINTDTSSFTYLAIWSKGKELQDLEKSLDLIYRESKALMKDIEKELDGRGLTLQLEPKEQTALTVDEKNAAIKEYSTFLIDKTQDNDNMTKGINELLGTTKDDKQLSIIKEQLTVVKKNNAELAIVNKLIDELPKSDNRAEQNAIMQKADAAMTRCGQFETQFNALSEQLMVEIEQNQPNLKNEFDKNPVETLQKLQKEYEGMKDLTEQDLKYISTSKFISREYGKYLRTDPQQFVSLSLEQLSHAKAVQAKNGTFVEFLSCEKWGDTPIVEKGTVAHPKVANNLIEQAEMQIRGLKMEADNKGDYYPYSKCQLTVYSQTEKGMSGIYTQIDIGDSEQKNLLEHMEQVCSRGKEKGQVLTNFTEAHKERAVKDKFMTPPAHNTKKTIQVQDEHITQNMEGWNKGISDKRESNEQEKDQDGQERDTESDKIGEHDKDDDIQRG